MTGREALGDSSQTGRPKPSSDRAMFERLYPGLRQFASAVAPVDIDPDDLVQDALEAVLRTNRLGSIDNPRAYLRRAIVNRLSNESRGLGRRRAAIQRLGEPLSLEQAYPSDIAWLTTVPPLSRAVVYLHHVDGYTYAEIGELLGITERAARTRSNRAVRRLRSLLTKEARP